MHFCKEYLHLFVFQNRELGCIYATDFNLVDLNAPLPLFFISLCLQKLSRKLRRKALAGIISLIELFTRLGNIILFPKFKADIIQENKMGKVV
jgi:hypothetical protein